MSQRPRRTNANLHPGQIVVDSQVHRRTSQQKRIDDEALQQAKDAQLAAVQKGYDRIGAIENTMAEQQWGSAHQEVPIKPLRPRPRPQQAIKAPATALPTADQAIGGMEVAGRTSQIFCV